MIKTDGMEYIELLDEEIEMKVSVITPTYKRNDYINRAIESIINQDYPDIEILVIDDNGVGTIEQLETENKLKPYINKGLIKYICNEKNLGGANARNVGIINSTGEYITFLDDDDVYLPGKISVQVKYMMEKDLDVCVMDGETYDRNGNMLSHKTQPIEDGMEKEELLKAHIIHHITGTNVFMYKREAILKVGGFDDIPAGQEYMLMQKTIVSDMKIGCIHEVYVHFHMDGQNRISTNLSKVNGLKRIFEEKKKYFDVLTKKEKSFVRSKYYGTLFYVYFKNKKYFSACIELLKAVLCSPSNAWATYQERKGKLKSK